MGFGVSGLLATLEDAPPRPHGADTHPGHPDEELARLTVFAEGRDRELTALTLPAVTNLVRRQRIRLSNFGTTI